MKAIICIIFLYSISCSNIGNKKHHIPTIKIPESPRHSAVKLSDFGFADIEYIPLETKDNCMIQRIIEIDFGKEYFLTKYSNTILKFRHDGLFVTRVGTVGRGPEEFTDAHDVEINNSNQEIYIVSAWQKKFNVYTEDGEFFRSFKCPSNTTSFKVIQEGILCYNMNSIGNVDFSFNLISDTGRIIFNFPNTYDWNYNNKGTYVFVKENVFYNFKDQLFKKEVYSDTVYVFKNKTFEASYVLDVGNLRITQAARSDFSPEYIMENYLTPWNLFEFGPYVYYEFTLNHKLYGLIAKKDDDKKVFFNPYDGIINDLDGGPAIWPKTIKDDNSIISWIDAYTFKQYIASEAFRNSTPKMPNRKKELEKIGSGLLETDNPILIIVRLK